LRSVSTLCFSSWALSLHLSSMSQGSLPSLQTTLVSQAPADLMLTLVESLVSLAIPFCFEVTRSFECVLMDFWDDFEF
jgi:hypothetical protein